MNVAWIDPSFSLRFTTALLHFLWQGCAVGAVVVVGGFALRRAPAQWRYVLNVAALLVMAACLPATFVLLDGSAVAPSVVSDPGSRSSHPVTTPTASVAIPDPADNSDIETALVMPRVATVPDVLTTEHATTPSESMPPLASWFTVLYFVGVALMLLRLAGGLRGGHRLRRSAIPIDDDTLLTMIRRQARRIGLRRVPAAAWCYQISIPVVIGVLRPLILLPPALASGLSPDQVQALMTHELAHIRRLDLLVNMLQRLVEAVLFFHPVVWFVSRRINVERENATDDMVLAAGWRPPHYADALLRMAEVSSSLRNTGIAPQPVTLAASGHGAGDFKRRVLRLVDGGETTRLHLTRRGLAVLVFLTLMSLSAPIAMHALAQSPETSPSIDPSDKRAETSAASLHVPGELEFEVAPGADDTLEATVVASQSAPRREGRTADEAGEPETGSDALSSDTFDRSQLPRVAETYRHETTVLGDLVTGGGIIERIEEDVIHFRSGDHIKVSEETWLVVPATGDQPLRRLPLELRLLEPGMAIGYSMRDGKVEKLDVTGIVAQPPAEESVFDTIRELRLKPGTEYQDSLDGRFPIRVTGKDGPVLIAIGQTHLIELPESTMLVEWQIADYRPEGVEDIEPFDYLLVQWRKNGRITWTCYQSPEDQRGGAEEMGEAGIPAATDSRIVYVIDSSYSMADDNNFLAAKTQLTAGLQRLNETQQFQVIFYNSDGVEVLRGRDNRFELFRGTDAQRLEAATQYRDIQPHGGTDHYPALRRALEFAPDVVVLLTDGSPPPLSARESASLLESSRDVQIHCVQFGRDPSGDAPSNWLERLSRESGGTCVYRRLAPADGDDAESPTTGEKRSETDALRRDLEQIQTLESAADAERDSARRVELLHQAVEAYAAFHNQHRSQLAGLWARFHQARCLRKLGDGEEADAILEELLELPGNGEGLRELKGEIETLVQNRDAGEQRAKVRDLVTTIEAEWERAQERIETGHAYADKVTFGNDYEQWKAIIQPTPDEITAMRERITDWYDNQEAEPGLTWRIRAVLAPMLVDEGDREAAHRQFDAALEAYPDKDYPSPSKYSYFHHLANQKAMLVWDDEGLDEAVGFFAELLAGDSRCHFFFAAPWRQRLESEGNPEAWSTIRAAVLEAYERRAREFPEDAAAIRARAAQLSADDVR